MRNCVKTSEFELYQRGSLSDSAAELIRHHLEQCDACRIAFDEHKRDHEFLVGVGSLTLTGLKDDGSSRGPKDMVRPDATAVYPNIDGYEISGVLGQGGMGIVYRAVQSRLNRTVALKVLPAMVGTASPSAVARFRREATAAARLHHTNIVPIYDFGESRDAYFYAMELIIGQPLQVVMKRLRHRSVGTASPIEFAQMLRETITEPTVSENLETGPAGKLDDSADDPLARSLGATMSGRRRVYYQQVARWMADTADALHYAHGQGIVHRDIKPANLIVSIDGRIMLADFGLAKSVEEESVTMTGSLLGTLRYISPEQAMAKRVRVDHRTDIYSLGATMYELLCFQPAFPGQDGQEVLGAIISRDPVPPRKILSHVPQELETICQKAMEKSPEARYATARAIAEDLRRFIQDLPIVAKRPGPIKRAIKFVRRRKAATAAVVAGLLLIIVAPILVKERSRRHLAEIARVEALRRQQAEEVKRKREEQHRKSAEGQRDVEEISKLMATVERNVALEEFSDAERDLQTLRVLRPNNADVFALSAWKILEQSRITGKSDQKLLDEAMSYCDTALALASNQCSALNYKGIILKRLGKYPEAIGVAERAVECNKDWYSAWANLGAYYAILGQINRAEEKLLKSIELAANVVEGEPDYRAMAWNNLAACELHLGRSSAIESARKAVNYDRSNYDARLTLARVFLAGSDESNWDVALSLARSADDHRMGKDPRCKRIHALTLVRERDWADAIKEAQAALEKGDLPTPNELAMSIAFANLGQEEECLAALQRAIDSWPEDLNVESSFRASYDNGVLWFDSASELHALRAEAEQALHQRARQNP